MQLNQTQFAAAVRESTEHILDYIATEDSSHLAKATERLKDARKLAHSRREQVASYRLSSLATSLDWAGYAGLARKA